MSIVKMQKLAVIGLDQQKESIMTKLMDFGAVELTDQKKKLADEKWNTIVTADDSTLVAEYDGKLSQAAQALSILEKYDKSKAPLFQTRRSVSGSFIKDIKAEREETEKAILEVLNMGEELKEIADRNNKLEQDRILLIPWEKYGAPLGEQDTRKTKAVTGVVPSSTDTTELNRLMELKAGGAVMKVIGSDKDFKYIAVAALKSRWEKVAAILKEFGYNEISLKDFQGTVAENLARIEKEKEKLAEEKDGIIAELVRRSSLIKTIENYYDMVTIEADKERIKSKLLKTKTTFYMEGWLPARYVKQAESLLEEEGCFYRFAEPEEGDEVPVLLDNKNFFVPFEAITEMYSLPDYKGFDPTSIYAFFYALFFGMMLSDAGYGIIMTIACFVAFKKFNLEGTMKKMAKLFFYCGISTTFWGVMFGGWFGDIVQVFSRTFMGKEIIIEPIWFNPLDDPMLLLIFSLGLGIVHLFVGMGIKAYMQIKEGNWFDALCDEGFWYFTIVGLIAWLGGGSISPTLPKIGMWLAIIGMAGLLLTGGRHNKGIGKITGGLGNIYNITSYMSDILSYARLLALGLATGVIAQVVNTMGSLFGGGVVGFILLLIIFVVGHVLNFAINVLGAFIHSSRLQYVEFFGKFYEDGGEPFDPFRKKTKYIKIQQEEE